LLSVVLHYIQISQKCTNASFGNVIVRGVQQSVL
jgi:hypothetical protein